jgi:protein-tyrosine-phosphatase
MAQDSALRVSRELGTPLDGHEATSLASLAISPADIVVCMDAQNEANVLAAHPTLAGRVFRVGDIFASGVTPGSTISLADRELRDPYGLGDARTREAFEHLVPLTLHWGQRLLV